MKTRIAIATMAVTLASCGGGQEQESAPEEGRTGPSPAAQQQAQRQADEQLRQRVRQWPERWCEAEIGMTPEQLVSVMGPPTTDLLSPSESGGNPQLQWEAFDFSFTAFFNIDNEATQLQTNDLSEQSSEIDCESLRSAE